MLTRAIKIEGSETAIETVSFHVTGVDIQSDTLNGDRRECGTKGWSMDSEPTHGYKTLSSAQQVLRFVSQLYLGWYVLSALAAIIFLAFYLLTGFDITDFASAVETSREASLASGLVFLVDLTFNIVLAVAAFHCADHPRFAKRFRVFAFALVLLSLASCAHAAVAAQLANLASSLYSLFINGLLLYLVSQIMKDDLEGRAYDVFDLQRTPSGKVLRSDRQVRKAIERGEIPPLSTSAS